MKEMDEYDFWASVALATNVQEAEAAIVPYLSQLFSVQSIILIRFSQNGDPEILFRWIPDKDLRNFFDDSYPKLGFMLDPYFQMAFAVDDWQAFGLREIAPDRFETSEYFANYFGRTNMVDEMGFVVRLGATSSAHLSLGRNSGHRRLRSNELPRFKQLAKVLAPKLRQILKQQPPHAEISDGVPLHQRYYVLAKERGTGISLREAEVAALIVQGHSSRAIGLRLGIATQTVKVHRRTLYKKLHISSQSEMFGLLNSYVGSPKPVRAGEKTLET